MKEFFGEITFKGAVELIKTLPPGVAEAFLKTLGIGIFCGSGCIVLHKASEKGYIDRVLNILEHKENIKDLATV